MLLALLLSLSNLNSESVDQQVLGLLNKMNLSERVAQLQHATLDGLVIKDGQVTHDSLVSVLGKQGIGVVSFPLGASADRIATCVNSVQRYLRTETRLKVPAIVVSECLHGPLAVGATIFPQAIAQGSTWNPDLIQSMSSVIAREAISLGASQCLSPLFDLARDPRYGRVEECFGECPTLVSQMGVAWVNGAQGKDVWTRGLAMDKIACTTKHFAGYSVPAAGINLGPASLGEREMRSLYLPPFEAAVKSAHVMSVMPSYNEVDGVPAHGNPWLLNTVLRKEWGFPGYVYSDWGGVEMLHSFHHVVASVDEAGVLALRSGVDVEAPGPEGFSHLEEAVKNHELDPKILNLSVSRVLREKFLAGLMGGSRPEASPALRKPDASP